MKIRGVSMLKVAMIGVLSLAGVGVAVRSQAATTVHGASGHPFSPGDATCFLYADYGKVIQDGSCSGGGIWYVLNPPVSTTGSRAVKASGQSGLGTATTVNAVVSSKLGAFLRQSGPVALPAAAGEVTLSASLAINANEYLEFDALMQPNGTLTGVLY